MSALSRLCSGDWPPLCQLCLDYVVETGHHCVSSVLQPQDTVAALIQVAPSTTPPATEPDIDGLPFVDNTPIDFSGGTSIDGVPIEPVSEECTCVCVCMYVYVCMCVCMYVCMYVYMYACMCTCMYVCMYVCP